MCARKYGILDYEINVHIEPNNYVDKFVASVEKERNIFGHLTKVALGKFAKTILFPSK